MCGYNYNIFGHIWCSVRASVSGFDVFAAPKPGLHACMHASISTVSLRCVCMHFLIALMRRVCPTNLAIKRTILHGLRGVPARLKCVTPSINRESDAMQTTKNGTQFRRIERSQKTRTKKQHFAESHAQSRRSSCNDCRKSCFSCLFYFSCLLAQQHSVCCRQTTDMPHT